MGEISKLFPDDYLERIGIIHPCRNEKRKKNVLLDNFIKHKPLISEEQKLTEMKSRIEKLNLYICWNPFQMTYCSGSNASKSIPIVLFFEILDISAKSLALSSLINFSSCFTKSIQISGVLPFGLLTRGFEFFPCLMEHCDLKRSAKKGENMIYHIKSKIILAHCHELRVCI